MALEKYHLTKKEDGWTLKKEGNERATKVFDGTKEEAIRGCAEMLSKSSGASLRIHGLDGKIQEERTYPRSADPRGGG